MATSRRSTSVTASTTPIPTSTDGITAATSAPAAARVTAPIPARVARILVAPGAVVRRGAPLVVLEAMKMELTLFAPADGTVATVRHQVDDMVEEGTQLVTFVQAHSPALP